MTRKTDKEIMKKRYNYKYEKCQETFVYKLNYINHKKKHKNEK